VNRMDCRGGGIGRGGCGGGGYHKLRVNCKSVFYQYGGMVPLWYLVPGKNSAEP
jgi:hypothetical protein